MKKFEELNLLELDTIREIGSIGTGNAATALSSMLGAEVRISLPQVRIMGYNEAIDWIGGPEAITSGVLVGLKGEINGVMLCVQQLPFVQLVLRRMLGKEIASYEELDEICGSALVEVGNIMVSTFVNALCGLAGIAIKLTVPAFALDMQGAILAVPMAEYGFQSDYILTISSEFICEGETVPYRMLLSPDVRSLNFLLEKLGVLDG